MSPKLSVTTCSNVSWLSASGCYVKTVILAVLLNMRCFPTIETKCAQTRSLARTDGKMKRAHKRGPRASVSSCHHFALDLPLVVRKTADPEVFISPAVLGW